MKKLIKRLIYKWLFSPEWHDRSEPTPDGVRLWATDGGNVWEIWGTGKPISKHATLVKYWAVCDIPDPYCLDESKDNGVPSLIGKKYFKMPYSKVTGYEN